MPVNSRVPTRDFGLELGLLFTRYLLESEELHYGYWTPGLEVKLRNLPQAQRAHTDLIISKLPAGAKRVLDVGCGTGGLALRLLESGRHVECVAPDSTLLDCAEKRLGGRARIHRAKFEEFAHDGPFDAIVFSESFQYVPMPEAMLNVKRLLAPGGTLLICDFFKRPHKPGSPIGGGHRWHMFEQAVQGAGMRVVEDLDITEQTAPTITLVEDFLARVGTPGYELVSAYTAASYPLSTRFVRWLFRKRLAKVEHKYFQGNRTAAAFIEFKMYRLLRLERA